MRIVAENVWDVLYMRDLDDAEGKQEWIDKFGTLDPLIVRHTVYGLERLFEEEDYRFPWERNLFTVIPRFSVLKLSSPYQCEFRIFSICCYY